MAIATDLNPGSSYCEALPLQLWLATTHFGMTVEEAWLGVTRYAAKALALPKAGTIAGRRARGPDRLGLRGSGGPSRIATARRRR